MSFSCSNLSRSFFVANARNLPVRRSLPANDSIRRISTLYKKREPQSLHIQIAPRARPFSRSGFSSNPQNPKMFDHIKAILKNNALTIGSSLFIGGITIKIGWTVFPKSEKKKG